MKFNKKMTVIFLNIYYAHKGSYDSLKKKITTTLETFPFPTTLTLNNRCSIKWAEPLFLAFSYLLPESIHRPTCNY